MRGHSFGDPRPRGPGARAFSLRGRRLHPAGIFRILFRAFPARVRRGLRGAQLARARPGGLPSRPGAGRGASGGRSAASLPLARGRYPRGKSLRLPRARAGGAAGRGFTAGPLGAFHRGRARGDPAPGAGFRGLRGLRRHFPRAPLPAPALRRSHAPPGFLFPSWAGGEGLFSPPRYLPRARQHPARAGARFRHRARLGAGLARLPPRFPSGRASAPQRRPRRGASSRHASAP